MMRALTLWLPVHALMVAPLAAQAQQSPLRELPSLQVVIDHMLVPNFVLTDSGAESLRQRVIARLRAAGLAVTDHGEPGVTVCQVFYGPTCSVSQSTLFVSLNTNGCAFVANIYVDVPVQLAGDSARTSVIGFASRSFMYEMVYRDHSPVLTLLDDFIAAWRAGNSRED